MVTATAIWTKSDPLTFEPINGVRSKVAPPQIQVRYTSGIDKRQWQDILDEVQPEVVHLNSLFSRGFTLLPLRVLRQRPNVQVIMAPRGMLGEAALSIKPQKKRLFLALARGMGWMDGVRWHASSEQEAIEVRRAFPRAQQRLHKISRPQPSGPSRQTTAGTSPSSAAFTG